MYYFLEFVIVYTKMLSADTVCLVCSSAQYAVTKEYTISGDQVNVYILSVQEDDFEHHALASKIEEDMLPHLQMKRLTVIIRTQTRQHCQS